MRRVVILGSTGSVGVQALELISEKPDDFDVVALAAGGANPQLLAEQALDFQVDVVAISRTTAVQDVQLALYAAAQNRGWAEGEYSLPRIIAGPNAAEEAARTPADVVLNAITGAVGLGPTLAALEAGVTLALANKESLIVGGTLVTDKAKPGQIVPVDSEHSAIAQALRGESIDEVKRLVVTASGGPFRGWSRDELASVTPEQAAAHPTWDMGPVITINSATLINKGLEVIEAHLLFGLPMERIDVVVHPGSVVHSMVEFIDGSTMVQASPPDMRLPIALGLDWPRRISGASAACDWTNPVTWEFFPLDEETFPAVSLARVAGAFGKTAPAVYNAANEACVEAFMDGKIGFLDIVDFVTRVVNQHIATTDPDAPFTLESVLEADQKARAEITAIIGDGVRS